MKNKKELELYVHIPFCIRKCAYCDFLSFPAEESLKRAYIKKLIDEIRCISGVYAERSVYSIFIGGGTPSSLAVGEIEQLMQTLKSSFHIQQDAEITIEANPGSLSTDKLKGYKENGINRISLGLQSTDPDELNKLGRIHTFEDFLDSYQKVRQAGFHNVNVDLMSGLPGQSMGSWKTTLKKVLMLKPEHISAYSLILEEGTPFHNWYYHQPDLLPDEETDRQMYQFTKEYLHSQGYERYEISNYSKPGYECRHNIGYWTGTEYLGLGLGASSCVGGSRFHNEKDLQTYLDMTDLEELYQNIEVLELKDQMEEFMFLGLRLCKGVSGYEFLRQFGENMWDIYQSVIGDLVAEGLVELNPPYLRLSDRGIDISNYVLSKFLL